MLHVSCCTFVLLQKIPVFQFTMCTSWFARPWVLRPWLPGITPESWIAPKSIGEGASSLLGGSPGSPENVSCSRATPDLHRCKSGVALEQETFSGLPGDPPKRLPKGPFRTKNSTAPESVVFCYRRSFLPSVPFSCLFFLEKRSTSEHSL